MKERGFKATMRGAFDVTTGRAKYATIRERVVSAARVDGIHLCQLMAAMVIASIGLNIDSTEAIIGAMLICPLMGAVLAISLAIATMDMRLLHRACGAMMLECGICLITSTLYFCFSPLAVETTELLSNSSATVWDVLIALVGGFAGALGLSRRQEPYTLLAGVAVATALMPPLCAVGFGIAHLRGLLALSAFYEFLVNVVFIGFGSAAVFVWLRMPFVGDLDGDGKEDDAERAEAARESHVLRRRLALALVVFAIPCLYYSTKVLQSSVANDAASVELVDVYDTEEVTEELRLLCPGFVAYRVGVEDAYVATDDVVEQRVVATVETSDELGAARQRELEALIHLHVESLDEVDFEVVGE